MLIPPPIVALAAGLAQRAMTPHVRRPGAGRVGSAAALAGGSVALAVTSARSFRRHGTTLSPEKPDAVSVLVTTGPHALTRNPMYLGLTGVLLANAVRLRSWRALLPLAAFVAFIDRVQIPAEEAALAEHFGDDYREYCAAVPRWVGAATVDRIVTELQSLR